MSLEFIAASLSPQATSNPAHKLVPASNFSADELAEIYNMGRVDYIVPMPMNARRMQSYVRHYDVDLDASVVIFDSEEQPAGLGMLGVRDKRAWITRIGISPERRQHGMGQRMMDGLLTAAWERGIRRVQLEVIEGNEPAHRLFLKNRFQETRRLLVVRRPPAALPAELYPPGMTITPLSWDESMACLGRRGPGASWINENASLAKFGELRGLRVRLGSRHRGWVVYQQSTFELSHIICHTSVPAREMMTRALLYALHTRHPLLDTKIENIPVTDPTWPVYQQLGYIEEFRRVEMILKL